MAEISESARADDPGSGNWYLSEFTHLLKNKRATCAVYLIMLGEYADGTPYGLTIPFEAVRVYEL